MAQNPIDGGAFYRDPDGVLHKLEDGEYQLDQKTRMLIPPKRLTAPPKPPEPPVTAPKK
jgi:hypothetical protein